MPTRHEGLWLGAILVGALIIRLATLITLPSIHFPDEIFQVLEQTHGAVFGYRIVPWEFQLGVRSWILPGALAGPMWLGGLVSSDPAVYSLFVGTSLILLSMVIVAAAFMAGRRISLTHAIVAGVVAAVWFELVYQAGRTLTETVATVPLILALALAGKPAPRRTDLFWIGLLLGICVVLRFHLAPGVAVVGLWLLWKSGWRVAIPLAMGAAIPLLVLGVVDAWTWGMPFASIVNNFRANVLEGVAATFGESPFYHYVFAMLNQWQAAGPLLLLLALAGGRRLPLWLLTAGAILVSHSLIGHKETRFIFPAITCLVILAGIGTGEIVMWAKREMGASRLRRVSLPAALAAWVLTSLLLAQAPTQVYNWNNGRAGLLAFHWLHDQQDLCGLGLRGVQWWQTGGYAHLHRRVPIYDSDELDAYPDTYNYQVDRPTAGNPPPDAYLQVACFLDRSDEVCVYRRPGSCRFVDGFDPQPSADGVPG